MSDFDDLLEVKKTGHCIVKRKSTDELRAFNEYGQEVLQIHKDSTCTMLIWDKYRYNLVKLIYYHQTCKVKEWIPETPVLQGWDLSGEEVDPDEIFWLSEVYGAYSRRSGKKDLIYFVVPKSQIDC